MGTLNKFEVVIEPEKLAEEERPTAVQSRSKGFQSTIAPFGRHCWNGSLGMSAFWPKADLMKRKAVLGARFGSTFKQSAQNVGFVRSTEKNR